MVIIHKRKVLKDIQKILDELAIKYYDFSDKISIGKSEAEILSNNTIGNLIQNYCFFGSDGTSTSLSEEQVSPFYVSASVAAWGQINHRSKTFQYDKQVFISSSQQPHQSSIRTIMELKILTCLMIARKKKKFNCQNCPFAGEKCRIPNLNPKPWQIFLEKEAIGLTDLPVDFSFIRVLSNLDQKNRTFLIENLKQIFKEIKENEIPIIFVTHKSYLTEIKKEITSQFDEILTEIGEQTKILKNIIASIIGNNDIDLTDMEQLRDAINDPKVTDFDLLQIDLTKIGTPTPAFQVSPHEVNNYWDELKFHYLTWGYVESVDEVIAGYSPSCWVRIGYTPRLSPELAHQIILLEMMLGKGHSISLTMAHSACNLYKRLLIPTMQEYFNKVLPDMQKIGFNVKTMKKWSLFS